MTLLPQRHPWQCVDCGSLWPGRKFQATPFQTDRCACGGLLDGGWKDPKDHYAPPPHITSSKRDDES